MAAVEESNALLTQLTFGKSFDVPPVNLNDPLLLIPGDAHGALYQPIKGVTTEDFTTRQVGGTGVFDAMMQSMSNHLKAEYDSSRITGAEYTKAYIALAQVTMQSAVQFTLGKDQAFWEAQKSQIAAISARVQLEALKVQLVKAQYEALLIEVQYATGKLGLATANMQYLLADSQRQTAQYNLTSILPQQAVAAREQANAAMAQTSDYRADGAQVTGVLGRQKELYGQQIESYKTDSRVKTAKLYSDAWITMKTMDEGLLPPAIFNNDQINNIMTNLRDRNGL
jgi:hypothetical protein